MFQRVVHSSAMRHHRGILSSLSAPNSERRARISGISHREFLVVSGRGTLVLSSIARLLCHRPGLSGIDRFQDVEYISLDSRSAIKLPYSLFHSLPHPRSCLDPQAGPPSRGTPARPTTHSAMLSHTHLVPSLPPRG